MRLRDSEERHDYACCGSEQNAAVYRNKGTNSLLDLCAHRQAMKGSYATLCASSTDPGRNGPRSLRPECAALLAQSAPLRAQ